MRYLVLALLVGCSPRSGPVWPACIRAEYGDHASGVRQFRFDRDGNVVEILDRDNHGETLEQTAIDWSATAVTERRIVDPKVAVLPAGHGTLGPHGELLDWHIPGRDTTLRWDGEFRPAAPRRAFEMPYIAAKVLDQFVALDTRDRSFQTRMRAFAFTGTVTIQTGGDTVAAAYRDGRLVELWQPRSQSTFTWNDGDLVEVVMGSERVTVDSRGGRIRSLRTTGYSLELHYDGDALTGYAEHYPGYDATLAVTRCD
jgi:hypothetical protein